jgi:MtN3 and saliva related transmembrane protein
MNIIDAQMWLGSIAGVCTTLAFLPQVIATWTSRSAKDLSWAMMLTLCFGIVLWIVYGCSIQSTPLILSNGVTLVLTGTLVALKVRFRQQA